MNRPHEVIVPDDSKEFDANAPHTAACRVPHHVSNDCGDEIKDELLLQVSLASLPQSRLLHAIGHFQEADNHIDDPNRLPDIVEHPHQQRWLDCIVSIYGDYHRDTEDV